jgi:hypothetical protein
MNEDFRTVRENLKKAQAKPFIMTNTDADQIATMMIEQILAVYPEPGNKEKIFAALAKKVGK